MLSLAVGDALGNTTEGMMPAERSRRCGLGNLEALTNGAGNVVATYKYDVFVLGLTNLTALFLILSICCCVPGVWRLTRLMNFPWYRRFFTFHCYFWHALGISGGARMRRLGDLWLPLPLVGARSPACGCTQHWR